METKLIVQETFNKTDRKIKRSRDKEATLIINEPEENQQGEDW